MKTIFRVVDQEKHDGLLVLEEKEKTQLGPVEILLEIKACKTCSFDTKRLLDLFQKKPKLQVAASLEVAGTVSQVGPEVCSVRPGDRVIGLLSLSSDETGLGDYCVLGEYDVAKLPESIDYVTAVSSVGDGLKAYTALQYLGRVTAGDVVLVLDAASSWGRLVVQLAGLWGAKVIATISTLEERYKLEKLPFKPDVIIEINSTVNTLASHVLEETGGMGVSVVIDNGVALFPDTEYNDTRSEKCKSSLPLKHDIISMLSVGGRWITSHPHMQLDPPNCELLYLRGASVGFLFPYVWMLCPIQQGKLQHILHNFLTRLEKKEVIPSACKTMSFQNVIDSLKDEYPSVEPGMVVTM